MEPEENQDLPHRVSKKPQDVTNPKTPRKIHDEPWITPEWEKTVENARKISADKTKEFLVENAKPANTPTQKDRIVSSKIEELEAQHNLANVEAEYLSAKADQMKRERSEEDLAELLVEMRKKRKTAATFLEQCQNLKEDRATFVESVGTSGAGFRVETLELLLSTPTSKSRALGRKSQSSWKIDLIDFYNGGDPNNTKKGGSGFKRLWCPVLASYYPAADIIAAHLVPDALTPEVISHLTGTDMMTTRLKGNGILLHSWIEGPLDSGHIALVPTDPVQDPVKLKLVIIDESIRNQPYGSDKEKWHDLDGRVLQFKNDRRPQKRFLYLRYCMTMIYAHRMKLEGYELLHQKVWPSRIIWASPGNYLRKSALLQAGGIIGEHLDETFEDDEEHPPPSEEVSRNLTARFQAVIDSAPSLNDDDEDDDEDDDAGEESE